jgi:hypothetical protein
MRGLGARRLKVRSFPAGSAAIMALAANHEGLGLGGRLDEGISNFPFWTQGKVHDEELEFEFGFKRVLVVRPSVREELFCIAFSQESKE